MKKLTILSAFFIAAASVTMTSCVKDSESASVENVRSAKAEQLKALAAMQKSQGDAALILANAEKTIKEAEAKLREAEAAVKLAKAEHQKTQTEISKVALEVAKANLEVTKQYALNQLAKLIHTGETDKIARQIEMNKLKVEMEMAMSNQSNFKLQYYYDIYRGLVGNGVVIFDYNTELSTYYSGLSTISGNIISSKQSLFNAQWNLTSEGYTVQSQIESKKRDIATEESLIETYKSQKDLGYDGYLAEAKKFDDLSKAGTVTLQGLANKSTKALAALEAARQVTSSGKPNGAMYDSEFAVAARLLNSTQFPMFTHVPEEINWMTFTFVPTQSYKQPVKTYTVLGHSASYSSPYSLDNYGTVDKANLTVQVDNYAVAYETYFTNVKNQRQRNLNYWNAILEKSTKDYNDSLALRPARLAAKESTFDTYLSPFNKSVALAQDYPTKSPYMKNIGGVASLVASDIYNVIPVVESAITLVVTAITEVTAEPASENRTKELALLNGLKDQYGELVLPAKAYRSALTSYDANVDMMGKLLTYYMKNGDDISIENATKEVNQCNADIAQYNASLSEKEANLAKIKAAQTVVNDPAKVSAYGELFAKAKEALSAYSDVQIESAIQTATNTYNSSMSSFYLSLATAIQTGSAIGQNVIDQAIKTCEQTIASFKNDIERLEKLGLGNNTEATIAYYKEMVAQYEAEYKRTEAMAAKYKALLDAEVAKGN